MQRITLNYSNSLWHDVGQNLYGFFDRMRKAVCVQPDGSDDAEILLLQLDDGPNVVNQHGDRYSYNLTFSELK